MKWLGRKPSLFLILRGCNAPVLFIFLSNRYFIFLFTYLKSVLLFTYSINYEFLKQTSSNRFSSTKDLYNCKPISGFFICITTHCAVHLFYTSKTPHERSLMFTASEFQEDKMRLITRFELATKNKTELQGFLREMFNELAKSSFNTHQRRNALASIENIQREISLRR